MTKRKGESYLGGHTIWPSRSSKPEDNDISARRTNAEKARIRAKRRARKAKLRSPPSTVDRVSKSEAKYFVENLAPDAVTGMPFSVRDCIEQRDTIFVVEQLNSSGYLKEYVGRWDTELVNALVERNRVVAAGKLIKRSDRVAVRISAIRKESAKNVAGKVRTRVKAK